MKTKQVVLITGASSGIGKDAAEKILAEGNYKVYVAARRLEKMKYLEEKGAAALRLDITDDQSILDTVNEIKKQDGGIDILVNNAGYATQGPVEEVPIGEVRKMYEVNLFGLGRLTQLSLPYMRERKNGKIINISSVVGKVYFPLGAWYIGTKHALEGLSDSLRLELKPYNIHVVIIEPGAIRTEFNEVALDPLLDSFSKGPYGDTVRSFAEFTRKAESSNRMYSPPSVISKLILKAIKSKRPKRRYAGGAFAKPMIFIRKRFGDRVYDKMVSKMLG